MALSSIPLLALLYGISVAGDGSPALGVALAATGVAGVAAFARRQLRMERPYLDVSLMRSRRFRAGCVCSSAANAVLPVLMVALPLYLQGFCGASATASGLALAPVAVGAALASVIAGKGYDAFGAAKVVAVSAFVAIAGAAWLLLLGEGAPVAAVSLAGTLVAVGAMAANVPLNTWSVHEVDAQRLSHANAVASTVRQVFSSLAPPLWPCLRCRRWIRSRRLPALRRACRECTRSSRCALRSSCSWRCTSSQQDVGLNRAGLWEGMHRSETP